MKDFAIQCKNNQKGDEMGYTFKAAFSAICSMVDIEGETAKYTDEMFDQSTCPQGLEIAALVNPFHDHKLEKYIVDYFEPRKARGFPTDIFMDSGGFQLIKGKFKGDKDEFKERIYKLMAEHAIDYAFCFDENPIDQFKVYHHDRVLPAAEATNKNIQRQIQVLNDKGGRAKVFPIFHCKEDERLETAEVLLKDLDFSRVAGVSFNSLVWGGSGTADFGKLAFFNELKKLYPFPNFIHLLSYGEAKLIVPFMVLQRLGFLGDDSIVSADSTSYTMGLRRWGFIPLMDGSAKRVAAKANEAAWEEFKAYFVAKCPELTEKGKTRPYNDTLMCGKDANLVTVCYMMVAKKAYSEMWQDPIAFGLKHKYLNEAQVNSLIQLAKTDDFKGYQEWRKEFKVVWTTRIRGSDSVEKTKSTLDAFF